MTVLNKRRHWCMALLLSVAALVFMSGCPKKPEVTTTPETQREEAPVVSPEQTAPDQKAEEERRAAEAEAEARERAVRGLQPVYFDFDESFIRGDAQNTLKANADWLKARPEATIRIEGNCDERGTKEYNQALGQRRAMSAKRYLTDLGVSSTRISLISYGKEKPVCTESTEECRQKNRRDDFVVVE